MAAGGGAGTDGLEADASVLANEARRAVVAAGGGAGSDVLRGGGGGGSSCDADCFSYTTTTAGSSA